MGYLDDIKKKRRELAEQDAKYLKQLEEKKNDDVNYTLFKEHTEAMEQLEKSANKNDSRRITETSTIAVMDNTSKKLKAMIIAEVAFNALVMDDDYKKKNEGHLKSSMKGFVIELIEKGLINMTYGVNDFTDKLIINSDKFSKEMTNVYVENTNMNDAEKNATIKELYSKYTDTFMFEITEASNIVKGKTVEALESEKQNITNIEKLCNEAGVGDDVFKLPYVMRQKQIKHTLLETINGVLLQTSLLEGTTELEHDVLLEESLIIYTLIESTYTLKMLNIDTMQLAKRIKDANYDLTRYTEK